MSAKKTIQYPEAFICPLTLECMVTPMMTRRGHTFERSAIISWVKDRGTHPLTREPLTLRDLILNRAMKERIDTWKAAHAHLLEREVSDTDASFEEEDSMDYCPILCVNSVDVDKFFREHNLHAPSQLTAVVSEEETTARQGRRRGFLRFGRRQRA